MALPEGKINFENYQNNIFIFSSCNIKLYGALVAFHHITSTGAGVRTRGLTECQRLVERGTEGQGSTQQTHKGVHVLNKHTTKYMYSTRFLTKPSKCTKFHKYLRRSLLFSFKSVNL
jgi:hypothetical protein